jgi:t-SNARE complex subunit (syntaxin)
MINEVEQSAQRINDIINDMGIEIEEHGHNLDVISDELMNTNRNMVQANEQLDEATELQKKSKKKYIFLVVLILLIILAVGGVIFFLTK